MGNWLDQGYRKTIADNIEQDFNKRRKELSLKRSNVYADKLNVYIKDYLRESMTIDSINEMPIIDSVNVQKRVVQEKSTIYKEAPTRNFEGLSDENLEVVTEMYAQCGVNIALNKSNIVYNNQDQSLLQVIPMMGKLHLRVLQPHHYDVVPNPINPEIADAYIISVFDENTYEPKDNLGTATGYKSKSRQDTSSVNRPIGDSNDYEEATGRYVVWTKDYNFMMDAGGAILNPTTLEPWIGVQEEDIVSPLAEMQILPFVDIAAWKEFRYFVDRGAPMTDFTIQLNAALSDLSQIVRMQGYSQGWLKGPADLLVQNVKVGPTYLLKLPTDPTGQNQDMDFGFATPGADIAGALEHVNSLISLFLTSNGIDPKSVSSTGEGANYSSGVERLLALFQKFEASRDDYELYKVVEKKLFKVIMAWLVALQDTDVLDENIKGSISFKELDMAVKFNKPQSIMSESEKLDLISKRRDLGLSSRVKDLMEIHDIDREAAEEMIKEIDQDEMLIVPVVSEVRNDGN